MALFVLGDQELQTEKDNRNPYICLQRILDQQNCTVDYALMFHYDVLADGYRRLGWDLVPDTMDNINNHKNSPAGHAFRVAWDQQRLYMTKVLKNAKCQSLFQEAIDRLGWDITRNP